MDMKKTIVIEAGFKPNHFWIATTKITLGTEVQHWDYWRIQTGLQTVTTPKQKPDKTVKIRHMYFAFLGILKMLPPSKAGPNYIKTGIQSATFFAQPFNRGIILGISRDIDRSNSHF